jgi:hypothetical protein
VGLLSAVLLAVMLAEFFIVFLLPRRVNRDPAIARGILRTLWIPWRAGAGLLPRGAGKALQNLRGGDGAWLPRHRDRLPAGAVPIRAFSRRESAGEYLLE